MCHLKCLKSLRVHDSEAPISWQLQSTSKGRWTLKRLLMEFVSHLGKKLLLPELLDAMLYELNSQDPQRNDCWTCLKVRLSFRVPASWKSLLDILQDTEESDWHTAITRQKRSSNFLLHGKVWWIQWACELKMDAPIIQKNFGWLSRQ